MVAHIDITLAGQRKEIRRSRTETFENIISSLGPMQHLRQKILVHNIASNDC